MRQRLDQGGGLSNEQRDFRDWCRDQNVPHAVCDSVDGAFQVLREHEIWTPPLAVLVQPS
jgi:hypothetical protein